jgi:DNA-directed RNA polymerases I, II, and III subunit RPABC2
MSLEQVKEEISLPLDEIAAEISSNLDNTSYKEEDIDLFSQTKEDSDVGSQIGSDMEDDEEVDDSIKLQEDEIDFDDAISDMDDEEFEENGYNMPCKGFNTNIVKNSEDETKCDYTISPQDHILKKLSKNDRNQWEVLKSKTDIGAFIDMIKSYNIDIEQDCIEKLNTVEFKNDVSDLSEKEVIIMNNETKLKVANLNSDEDDDDDDDDDEQLKKLESGFDNSILLDYHPELKQANYNEILAMSKVVRNSKNEIIDPLHKTLPWLTKFEVARILGLRSKQINNGADTFVDVPPEIISGYTIAEIELQQKKIPFILRRPLPNGGSEYWRVSDLDIIDI